MRPSMSFPRFANRLRALAATAFVLAAAIAPRPADAQLLRRPGAGGAQAERVSATLLADVASVAPGESFRVGFLYRMDPHWHIYWRSPGESGLPTKIEWNAPAVGEIGPLRWPEPIAYDDAGIASYGYENEVLIFANATAPADAKPGDAIEIAATTEWLVCALDGSCIPGDAEGSVSVAVGETAPSDAAATFDRFAALAPVAASESAIPVEVRVVPSPVAAPDGIETTFRVEVEAKDGWRIRPDGARLFQDLGSDFQFSRKTECVALESGAGIAFVQPAHPYEDTAPGAYDLTYAVAAPATSPQGEERTLRVLVPVRVEVPEGADPAVAANPPGATESPDPSPAPSASSGPAGATPPPADGPVFSFLKDRDVGPDRPLVVFLLFAFLGGILLNIMPCVLPVLSIKILSFVNQAGSDRRRILQLGLVFAAGVFVSFAALATLVVALQGAGRELGWGFQMTQPRFLVVMCGVIFAFGLSMFGVYEIDLPGSAARTADGLQRREGPAGAFFNGVLATVLATPCTAPMLGPALGFAFSQPAMTIYAIFLAVAAGLAAPYVLLSAFPGWLKLVPKPGNWMNRFKESMGFLLMATVVWLLWILGRQTGPEGIVAALAFLVALGAACRLLGLGLDFGASPRRRRILVSLALVCVAVGYSFPERRVRAAEALAGDGDSVAASENGDAATGIVWEDFSVARVEELAAAGRTIFVDFTADWCLTCKVNEKTILSTAEVARAFREADVAALKADFTRQPPEMLRIIKAFGRAGVPLYIVFPGGNPGDPVVLPEALTTGIVVEAVQRAGRKP